MKKFRLRFDEPVAVAMGPTWEEIGWGPWQFPSIGMGDDGTIYTSCHSGKDSALDYGKESFWFASTDGGETWKPTTSKEGAKGYLKCPNGDSLKSLECPPVPTPEGLFDGCEPVFAIKDGDEVWKVYRFDDIKPGYFEKKWKFRRLKAGEDTPCEEFSPVLGWDHMPIITSSEGVLPPFAFGRLRKAPDNSMWLTHYCNGLDPETGESVDGLAEYFFRSDDNGKTWKYASWIDPRKTDGAYVFCEGDITWTPSGCAVTLLRGASSFYAVSRDGGYTWDAPKLFDKKRYAQPSVKCLDCGVTLATIGRPGIRLRWSSDPDCENWSEPIDIIDEEHGMDSCCYTEILALSKNEAMIVYTHFRHKDENGKEGKTLMTVKVTVEEYEE